LLNNKPKVSIVLAAYNAEAHLKECIDSILCQSFSDFELLIYNDGSADRTKEIIESYKDNRIKATHLIENKGVVYCSNLGIKDALGEYIAKTDADDVSLLDRLKLQVAFLDKNPHIGLLGAQLKILGTNEIIQKPIEDEDIRWWFFKGCPVPQPTAIFRSSVVKEHNLYYDSDFKSAEDIEYWIQLAKVTNLSNLAVPTLAYRVHQSQESTANIKRQDFYRDKSLNSFFDWLGIESGEISLTFANHLFSDLIDYTSLNTIKVNRFFESLNSKNAISFFGKADIKKKQIEILNRFLSNLLDFHPRLFLINPFIVFKSVNASPIQFSILYFKCLLFWKTRK
jgi:glycosyltransferase involved in cell wall biosynthesis